ncbi:hypothetical protein QBC39DRAFT_252126 [Podospora conica]|nr:hypothetical protein QBC39DRAFT_252126 [Schizothecium conicum]
MDAEKQAAQQQEFEGESPKNFSPEGSEPELVWTEEEETAIRRKIDWHTVPLVTVLYMLTFLDRINIGNARIQGLGDDLELGKDYRFNWALSIFYIVYLLVEVPSNMILKRVGARYFLPLLVCAFGLVSIFTAFVTNFAGLMAARAFLGVFEGGAMPGMAFFLSCFYKRNELLFRIGIYVSAASIAGAFGGLLAAGLAKIPEWGIASMRIHTWRNIFFFEGVVTVIIGGLAPIWMPTTPATAYFLNDRQRRIAAERLIRESRSNPDGAVTWKHVKRGITCIHTYTCALGFFLINITVQGLSVFMPTILAANGWTATKSQLYSVPPYVCACVVAIAVAYASDKTKQRGIWLASFSLLAIAGFGIMRWSEDPNVRYGGIFLVTIGAFPGGPGFLSWAINNSGGASVRAVTSAWVVSLGTAGGIVSTWTYIQPDAPKYHNGHTINFVGQIAVFFLSIFGILYCARENRVRAAGKRDHRLEGLSELEQDELGYRHPRFHYWT